MRSELELAPKSDASRLRALPPLISPRQDRVSFKLSEPSEYRQHQPPMRRGGVAPRITERLERHANFGDSIQHVEQITGGSCQPVELANNQCVPWR
jgi:hypothetical protein